MNEKLSISLINSKKNLLSIFLILYLLLIFLGSFCSRRNDLQTGIEFIKKGEYLKAVKSLNRALHEDSINPVIHYNLSLAYAYTDSISKSFWHYLKLNQLGSNLKDDVELKELMANFLNLEPYPSSIISMGQMNQFKGSFSPSGQLIAVAAARIDISDIYLIKLDGTIVEKLTRGSMNTDPDFSPDGNFIVYVSDQDGDEELYLYDLKNRQTEKLTNNTAQDFLPSFSPDGNEIVFMSNIIKGWEIYKINLKDKRTSRLTKNEYWDGFPKFSRDGKWIVFSSKRDRSEDIYIVDKNGNAEGLIYSGPADDNDPTLFNDKLYFRSNESGEWQIYRLNLRNNIRIRLTYNAKPDWNLRLAKDGSKILFSRKRDKYWCLYFINLNNPISAELIKTQIQNRFKITLP